MHLHLWAVWKVGDHFTHPAHRPGKSLAMMLKGARSWRSVFQRRSFTADGDSLKATSFG